MTTSRGPVLIVGGNSLIGHALRARLEEGGVEAVGTSRRPGGAAIPLDLADDPTSWPSLTGFPVAVICAGETRIARCAAEPVVTARVNVDGTLALVRRLIDRGAAIIHLSTGMVFDGAIPHRREDEAPCPVNEYGRQKAAAERGMAAMGGGVTILRLSKVVSPTLPLFGNWLAALRDGHPIDAFTDLRMAPITLDRVTGTLTRMIADREDGVFHLSASRDVSYAEAARRLAAGIGAPPELVREGSAGAAGVPANARPAHTTLDMDRLTRRYGPIPPPPEEALDALAPGWAPDEPQ